jgi:hydroxymethylpyrimidine pyrophosphatase-like HAD family hydrolase
VRPSKPKRKRHLILATALDGALLGGSEKDRKQLAATFSAARGFRVIFVTSRNPEAVGPCLADPLVPSPDYIVGDVGATVVTGADLEPVQPLQTKLDKAWPGEEAVLQALKSFPYLERQEVPQQGRCAFYLAGEHLISAEMLNAVEAIGCSLRFSGGRYLDVLPRATSKGSTLVELLALEELDADTVVVAGNSLNDLSLFETELKGVAVGNAEAKLKQRVGYIGPTCLARAEGAGGILEGLEHHGILECA